MCLTLEISKSQAWPLLEIAVALVSLKNCLKGERQYTSLYIL
jgi:hypothetical protein